MGRHQLRLLKFAIRYQRGWHTYGTDQNTVNAIKSLARLGLIEINDTRQFRLTRKAYP